MTEKRRPIERVVAKEELERINGVLTRPHLLIGGLAVQQYYTARLSHDIDLICDFEVAQTILKKLYPSRDWKVEDSKNDEYRPSYRIRHKVDDIGTIIFGPKISEREPYRHLEWLKLEAGAKPFRGISNNLENILVPAPHALAYAKMISFLCRQGPDTKVEADLQDFCDLTNHEEFSVTLFYDFLRQSKASDELINTFRNKVRNYPNVAEGSCLHSLSRLYYVPSADAVKIGELEISTRPDNEYSRHSAEILMADAHLKSGDGQWLLNRIALTLEDELFRGSYDIPIEPHHDIWKRIRLLVVGSVIAEEAAGRIRTFIEIVRNASQGASLSATQAIELANVGAILLDQLRRKRMISEFVFQLSPRFFNPRNQEEYGRGRILAETALHVSYIDYDYDILCRAIQTFNAKVPEVPEKGERSCITLDCVTLEEFTEVLEHAHNELSRLAMVLRDTYKTDVIKEAREWRWPREWGEVGCGGPILGAIDDLTLDKLLQEIRKIRSKIAFLNSRRQMSGQQGAALDGDSATLHPRQ